MTSNGSLDDGIFRLSPNESLQAFRWWGPRVASRPDLYHPYWTLFPPPSQEIYYLFGLLVGLIGIFSVLGNGAVVYAFWNSPSLRKVKVFTMNLALSDFLSCLLTYWIFVYNSFTGGTWKFPKWTCTFYAATQGIFGFISIFSLAAIALERYAAIARLDSRWRRLSFAAKLAVCAGIWLYCGLVVSCPMWGLGDYAASGFLNTCCFDYINRGWRTRMFIGFLFVFGFFVPCGIVTYCYYYIYKATVEAGQIVKARMEKKETQTLQLTMKRVDASGLLCPPEDERRASSSLSSNSSQSRHSDVSDLVRIKGKDVRAAKLCLLLVALFVVVWTPYAVVAVLGQFGPKRSVTPWMAMIPSVIAKSATLYNPIVYLVRDTRFQRAFKKHILGRELVGRLETDSATTVYPPKISEDELDMVRREPTKSLSTQPLNDPHDAFQ